jgi:WXG100 family type VII secretion target
MEVETARSTENSLKSTHEQVNSLVGTLTNSVNSLQPAWMGNSATEFYATYDQWRTTMTQTLENLSILQQKLTAEIGEWEQMASKLA